MRASENQGNTRNNKLLVFSIVQTVARDLIARAASPTLASKLQRRREASVGEKCGTLAVATG